MAISTPIPEAQQQVRRYFADFMWREHWLIVELDDRESHDGAIAFAEDRVRDRAFQAAGFQVLRFTVAELLCEPEMVAATLPRRLSLAALRSC